MLTAAANILNKIKMVKLAVLLILSAFCLFSDAKPVYAASDDYTVIEGYACPSTKILQERYSGSCFPCQIVKVLISSFMRAAANVYDVSREAGTKLLLFGSAIWLVFWALKKVSSLTNPEPMAMMNELLIFLGKIIVAFVFINSGVGTLVGYAINPVLSAGADYGTALLNAGAKNTNVDLAAEPAAENAYNGPTEIVSEKVMNKILKFSEGVSSEIATNMVIGSALSCFAVQKGIHWNFIIEIHIPDIWLWLCGAAIWVVGLMLTLAVCYYLIDIPFKLGFAVLALPVVIGLWPFKLTAGKLKSVIMIAVNAAGTFLFLALAVSYAMVLINASLQNKDQLFEAFAKDDLTYVSDIFSITGPYFIIILFCYIYGFKMIGDISESMPKKFFGSSMASGADNPMHSMATAATGWLGQKALAPVKMASDILANQAGKAATTVAKAAGNTAMGVVGSAAGAAGNKIGKGVSFVGSKLATASNNAKAQLDEDGKRLDMNQASTTSKLGNKFQSGIAGMMGKTGQLIDKAGQKTSAGSNKLKAPLQNMGSQVGNAYQEATADLKQTIKDTAELLPESVGVAAAQVGNFFVKKSEDNLFVKNKDGNALLDKKGNPVKNISARLNNKIGTKLASLGSHIVAGERKQNLATGAEDRLAKQREKRDESAAKVASYIPGGLVRKLGIAIQRDANSSALHSGITADTMLANAVGRKLTGLGALAQANQAPAESHREKIKQAYAKIKGDNALQTAWNGVKGGAGALATGFVKGGARVFDVKKDWEQLKNQAGALKDTTVNFVPNTVEQFKNNLNNIGDAIGGTKDSITGFGNGYKDEVKATFEQALFHDGANTELKETRIRTGHNAKNIVKNLVNIRGVADAVRHHKESDNVAKDVAKGAGRDIRDAVFLAPAAALGTALVAKDVAEMGVEALYSMGIHTAFIGIDAAKLALTAIPVRRAGNVLMNAGAVAGETGKAALGLTGQAVNVVTDTAKTLGYAAKLVVNVPLRAVGGTIGFAAKTVDNTLYAAYSMTVKPVMAVGGFAKDGLGVGYRTLAATRVGKEVNKVAHFGVGTVKVGIKALQVATKMIKAAAGEGSRVPARIMTPEEKAKIKEEKRKRDKEEAKKANEKKRVRERQQREEEEREMERERREQEQEQQRQREEEELQREELRRIREEEEQERLRQAEEARRRRTPPPKP